MKRVKSGILSSALALMCSTVISVAYMPMAAAADTSTVSATFVDSAHGVVPDTPGDNMVFDSSGNLWFMTGNAIAKRTPAGTTTVYQPPNGSTYAIGGNSAIAVGPSDNIWFTALSNVGQDCAAVVGYVSPSGDYTTFSLPDGTMCPHAIVAGPDGNMWFQENNMGDTVSKIGRITPGGVITEFAPGDLGTGGGGGLRFDANGNLWASQFTSRKIAKLATDGTLLAEYDLPATSPGPNYIVAGSDGNMWFAEEGNPNPAKIGKISPSGTITEYPLTDTWVYGMTLGPDGDVWYIAGNTIHKITPNGVISNYAVSNNTADIGGIASSPDNKLWFGTWHQAASIGYLNLDSSSSTQTISDSQPTTPLSVASGQTISLDGARGTTTVQSGGTLMGTGSTGDLTVNSGATLAPGHSPGCITSGNLTLNGTYKVDVGGTTACSGYDQMKVSGTVDVTNGTLVASSYNGYVPKVGESYTIIDNDGSDAVTGTFTGIAEGGSYTNEGITYSVTYKGGDGNDVVLTVTNVDGSKIPGTPNTGFSLVSAHIGSTLAVTTGIAFILFYLARKQKPASKR